MASVRQAKAWQGWGTPQVTFASPVASGNAVVVVFPNIQDYHPFGPDIPTDDQSGVYAEDYESADLLNSIGETARIWVFSRRNITDGAQTITAPWADGQPHFGQAFFFELEGIDNSAPPSDVHFSTAGSNGTSSSIPLTANAATAVAIGCALWPASNGGASGTSGTTLFDDDDFSAGLYKALSSSGSNSLDFSWGNSRRVQQFGIVYESAASGGPLITGALDATESADDFISSVVTGNNVLTRVLTSEILLADAALPYAYRNRMLEGSLDVLDEAVRWMLRYRLLESGVSLTDEHLSQVIGGDILFKVLTSEVSPADELLKALLIARSLDDLILPSDGLLTAMQRFILLTDALSADDSLIGR